MEGDLRACPLAGQGLKVKRRDNKHIPTKNIKKRDRTKKKSSHGSLLSIGQKGLPSPPQRNKKTKSPLNEKKKKKKNQSKAKCHKYLQYYSPSSTVRNPPPTPPESDPNSDN